MCSYIHTDILTCIHTYMRPHVYDFEMRLPWFPNTWPCEPAKSERRDFGNKYKENIWIIMKICLLVDTYDTHNLTNYGVSWTFGPIFAISCKYSEIRAVACMALHEPWWHPSPQGAVCSYLPVNGRPCQVSDILSSALHPSIWRHHQAEGVGIAFRKEVTYHFWKHLEFLNLLRNTESIKKLRLHEESRTPSHGCLTPLRNSHFKMTTSNIHNILYGKVKKFG